MPFLIPRVSVQPRRRATNEAFIDYALRASLMDYVDKQILIQLRDGKQIIGDLRSFDQVSAR